MSASAWSEFWRTNTGQGCLPNAPALHARLAALWAEVAHGVAASGEVLDIAAGNGEVGRLIHAASPALRVTGVDYAAVGPAAARAGVRGGINATALPFADASFACVVSQFGIEYCPRPALAEAARVLRPGGTVCFVSHHAASPAVAHNAGRLAALRALEKAGLFRLAAAAARGRLEDPHVAAAIAEIRRRHALQSICEELPVALGQILGRPGAERGVAAITAMARAEGDRLAAMVAAALDEAGVAALVGRLGRAGVATTADPLAADGEATPFAWRITGRRA